MECSKVYQDSVFGSYFGDQSFLIHIFVERISFVIPYIREKYTYKSWFAYTFIAYMVIS